MLQGHRPKVGILAIGNELLSGSTLDTNTNFLAKELTELGFSVCECRTVGDDKQIIISSLNSFTSELVITTGGLGPTSDDLTRDSVADTFGRELYENKASLSRLEANAKARGRVLYETGRRQSLFPSGAEIFENNFGTADAFATSDEARSVVSLPGVPRELKGLFETKILPWLRAKFELRGAKEIEYFQVFGISESGIGQVIENMSLPIEVAYRPQLPVVLVSLSANDGKVKDYKNQILDVLGKEFIFSESPGESFSSVLGELLRRKSFSISTAESCTGGELASLLVSVSGASDYFNGSVVAYANEIKSDFLLVDKSVLEKSGAVSEEVAISLAKNIREKFGTDISLSTTGIAGPSGATSEKPTGTVYIGLSTEEFTKAFKYQINLERNAFRKVVSYYALDLARRHLLGHELTFPSR